MKGSSGSAIEAAEKRIGSVIASKYKLERLLGTGGMGAVYLVTHLGVERQFALKLLHHDSPSGSEAEARFEREARAAGRIGHPNIVDVFDLGHADDGALYMVMEMLPGESLAERIRRGPLPIEESIEIMLEVLRALEAAHAAGIVHRDIKPANIFLAERPDGKRAVKVLDFGIAKFASGDEALTGTGAILGSPLYMAPEQVRAERDVDSRADVWAVGATLYECLVGEPAHGAPSHAAVIARIVTMPVPSMRPRRPEVDDHLDSIVLRALSIDPAQRHGSCGEMRRALEGYLSGSASTVASLPPIGMLSSRSSRTSLAERRSPAFSAGMAILAGVAITALSLGIWRVSGPRPPSDAPPRAEESVAVQAVESHPSPSPAAPTPGDASAPGVASVAPSAAPRLSASVAQAVPSATPRREPRTTPHPVASIETRPTCAAGEQLSEGHCCRNGLVWQSDRCDRPLATSAPF